MFLYGFVQEEPYFYGNEYFYKILSFIKKSSIVPEYLNILGLIDSILIYSLTFIASFLS